MTSLQEHADTLVAIIGILFSITGFLFWNKLDRIERKADKQCDFQSQCREELPRVYATKEELKEHQHDFKEWQNGRARIKAEQDKIMYALENHQHDANGRVVR